jgi:hypothetical protein
MLTYADIYACVVPLRLVVGACLFHAVRRQENVYHTRRQMLILIAPTDKRDSTEGAKRNTSLFGVSRQIVCMRGFFFDHHRPFLFRFFFLRGVSPALFLSKNSVRAAYEQVSARAGTHIHTHTHLYPSDTPIKVIGSQ